MGIGARISRIYNDRRLFIWTVAVVFTACILAVLAWTSDRHWIILFTPLFLPLGWVFAIYMWELKVAARTAWTPWRNSDKPLSDDKRDV
jgi:hypothetical protein